MPFSDIVGNDRMKPLLRRAVREGRVGQSLIFAGPDGIGKRRFAAALAQALNCERPIDGDACGKCGQCFKVAHGEHPDVVIYHKNPDGQFIKIDQMREMSAEAQFKPFEGNRRVLIVDEAHRLNIPAANSILKALEEPPETSLIVLVTSRPYALLDTVRSRCQILSFAPVSLAELESYLMANYGRPVEQNKLIARLASGSIGRALGIDVHEYLAEREHMIKLVEAALIHRDGVELLAAAEHLGRKLERDDFVRYMNTLLLVLADLFKLKLDQPLEMLTNADEASRLGAISDQIDFQSLTAWTDKIEKLLQDITRNVSRQLALEDMLLSI
ncbi:MAG TPA: DNA polymerase III subunit delta' [Blastocatellia bacterium]|nr:DNA polymerase III subunit delta' [Blastocatellia bacterium]